MTNLVILEYWGNSLVTATRSRSSQMQLGNEGIHQCCSLKTDALKTWFYPMYDCPRKLQKGSRWQEKLQLLVTESKVRERTNYFRKLTISGLFFLISKQFIKISLRVYSATYSVCLKASKLLVRFVSFICTLAATQSIQQSCRRQNFSQKASDTLD